MDWSAGAVELLTRRLVRGRAAIVPRAGVSSFGVSGTNAHVILERHPADDTPRSPEEKRDDTWIPALGRVRQGVLRHYVPRPPSTGPDGGGPGPGPGLRSLYPSLTAAELV
ncbi:hypothetical protein LV779_19080 [Streptomyces thinghirensis]|nr:hypothetical protein [Streptomyces thinghirensis]